MFSIIDIETTGLDPKRDRITEIAIVLHDGLTVVERYSTLIHPERSIPQTISRITGITNEMVAEAPKFYEVAKKILELTRDKIFVAHNVEFDFRFIQEEFRSLGYAYKRDKLCTVRLSKKLIPGRKSYALGRLCETLQIPLHNAHRALADADATASLFSYLMQLKSAHPVYKLQNLDAINTGRTQKIQQYILKKLPEKTGVYRFLGKGGNILYIGKSTNMRQRAIQHYQSKEKKSRKMIGEVYNVEFEETGSELIALLLESEEIKRHQPPYNRARRKKAFAYALESVIHENGVLQFQIIPTADSKEPLKIFHTWISARAFLNELMDNEYVCPKFCGAFDMEGPCFHFQIRKCNGICCGKEDPEIYNARIRNLIETCAGDRSDQLIKGAGRNSHEYSYVLMLGGKYAGYGYLNADVAFDSLQEYSKRVVPFDYFPDADDLICSFLRSGTVEVEAS
ncbi:MAG: exonuclease domain-containing protein [Flavobacteriales bacterium]